VKSSYFCFIKNKNKKHDENLQSRQAHEQKSFQREAFVFLYGLVFKALNSEAHCKPMALTIRCI
jgi:hypothetical protein